MSNNAYLQRTTGLCCPVQDTSFAVFNLFLRKHKQRNPDLYPEDMGPEQPAHSQPEAGAQGQGLSMSHASVGGQSPNHLDITQEPQVGSSPAIQEAPVETKSTSSTLTKDPKMISSVQSTTSNATSNPGEPIESLFAAMIPFVLSLCEMEEQPLTATGTRKSRERLLQTYAAGLGTNAVNLLEALTNLNVQLKEVLTSAIPTVQPPSRQGKVQLQSQMQALLQRMRAAKEEFEEALNEINCLGDEDQNGGGEEDEAVTKVKEQLYGLCDRVYSGYVLPRCAVAEVLLSVKVALAIRTEDCLLFAQKGVESMFDWNFGLEGFSIATVDAIVQSCSEQETTTALASHRHGLRDLPVGSLQMIAATIGLAGCFAFRSPSGPRQALSTYRTTATTSAEFPLRDQCLVIQQRCGLPNLEGWIRECVDPRFDLGYVEEGAGPKTPPPEASAPLGRSKFGSSAHQPPTSTPPRPAPEVAPQPAPSTNGGLESSSRRPAPTTATAGPPTSSSNIEELFTSLVHYSDLVAHGSAESSSGGGGGQATSSSSSSLGQTAMRQNSSDLNYLTDVIGSVNIWLRRNGLYKEQLVSSEAGGGAKTSAPGVGSGTTGSSGTNTLFLDHDCNELIGWSKDRSATYSEACLRAQLAREQMAVCHRLLELATETENEDFFRVCHEEDMLRGLLADADNCCVMNECRKIVERRVASLMVVKVKVFHYSGEVRAITMPQRYKLKEMLEELQVHFLDAKECKIAHTDEDGDKVSLSTNQEWQDLIRMKRISHMVDGLTSTVNHLGRSSGNLQASTVGGGSVGAGAGGSVANTMKVDLFFDRPAQTSQGGGSKSKLTYVGAPGSKPGVGGSSTPKSVDGTPERPPLHLRPSGGSSSSLDAQRHLENSYETSTPLSSYPSQYPQHDTSSGATPPNKGGAVVGGKPGRVASANSLKDLQARLNGQQHQQPPLPPPAGSPTRPGPGGHSPQNHQHQQQEVFTSAMRQMERNAERHLGSAEVPFDASPVTRVPPPKANPVLYSAPPPMQPVPGVAPGGPEQVVVYVKDRPGQEPQQQVVAGGYRPTQAPVVQQQQHAPAPVPAQKQFQFQSAPQAVGGAPKPGQWGKPVAGHGPAGGGQGGVLDFAKHSMSTVALSSDDEEDDRRQEPNWNRGTEDHISAVLNSGDAQAHLRMLRHNGPYKRAGRK